MPSPETQAAWAEAVAAAKRYRRLVHAEYARVEGEDSAEARRAHAATVYADLACCALKAANGDDEARRILRAFSPPPRGGEDL